MREKLIGNRAKMIEHAGQGIFEQAEVAVRPRLFEKISRLLAVIGIIGPSVAACAVGPIMVDCERMGLPTVTDSTQRYKIKGGSVGAPKGENWCVSRLASTPRVLFYKNHFGGRVLRELPPRAERLHSFGAAAMLVEIEGGEPRNVDELRDFVERWRKSGGALKPGSTKDRMILQTTTGGISAGRFKLILSNVAPDQTGGQMCVRYNAVVEESGNPGAGGSVLLLTEVGKVCRHPDSARHAILLSASERYAKDAVPAQLLFERLRPEYMPVLESFAFGQIGP